MSTRGTGRTSRLPSRPVIVVLFTEYLASDAEREVSRIATELGVLSCLSVIEFIGIRWAVTSLVGRKGCVVLIDHATYDCAKTGMDLERIEKIERLAERAKE